MAVLIINTGGLTKVAGVVIIFVLNCVVSVEVFENKLTISSQIVVEMVYNIPD